MAVRRHATGRGHCTYEDLLRTPDDGKRYEVLEGALIVSPAPGVRHQRLAKRLQRLRMRAEEAGVGEWFPAPLDVVLSEHDVVEPDLLFVARGRLGIVTADNVHGVPDLVVEVISAGSRKRDVITKQHMYERHGVPFYWLVDPEEETVRVFERKDGPCGEPTALKAGQRLGCALFPGITQDVAQLFAEP